MDQTDKKTLCFKFINKVIKPWSELNELLCNPFAVQPGLSDFEAKAKCLSISLNHFAESECEHYKADYNAQCVESQLIRDVADASKHGKLAKPTRNNALSVASCFEYDPDQGFRFIRNSIFVQHTTLEELDLMSHILNAINWWMQKLEFTLLNNQILSLKEGLLFSPKVSLIYNENFCIHMDQTRIRFFKKIDTNNYIPVDPPEFFFEIL